MPTEQKGPEGEARRSSIGARYVTAVTAVHGHDSSDSQLTFASGGIRLDASSVSSGYGTCAGALMEIRRLKGSPCGRFIAAGCHDGTVVVWGVAHMQRWLAKHATAGKVCSLLWSYDDRCRPALHVVSMQIADSILLFW